MLVEKTIGNIKDFPGKEIEYVSVDWHECHKRILKKRLESGEELGIRLSDQDAQIGLKEGDVLAVIDNRAIAVSIAPSEALIVDAKTSDLIPKVCYEIGNRHAPFFKGDKPTEFYTPYEMPIKVMLEKIGASVKVGMVKLTHDRAISAAANVHGHSHDDGGYDGKGGKPEGSFYDHDGHEHKHDDDHEHHHDHNHEHHHDHDHGHHHEHEHNHDHGCGCHGKHEH